MCCGHSLGGSIAAVTCALLRATKCGQGATAIAIGPMACVSDDIDFRFHDRGESETSCNLASFATSVVLGMDPAPRMTAHSVDRLVSDLADATIAATASRAASRAVNSLFSVFGGLRSSDEGDKRTDEPADCTIIESNGEPEYADIIVRGAGPENSDIAVSMPIPSEAISSGFFCISLSV